MYHNAKVVGVFSPWESKFKRSTFHLAQIVPVSAAKKQMTKCDKSESADGGRKSVCLALNLILSGGDDKFKKVSDY